MFAEPPKENIIQEDFEVLVCKQNQLQDFNPRSKGLYQSVFSYLLRNYYYRNQAEKFLEILANGDSSSSTFYMIRKYNNSNRQAAEKMIIDTVAVYENKHFN